MKKLQIDGNADLYKIISFIKNSKEDDINIEFLNDSIVHKNASNINILKKHAESLGKTISFGSENPELCFDSTYPQLEGLIPTITAVDKKIATR